MKRIAGGLLLYGLLYSPASYAEETKSAPAGQLAITVRDVAGLSSLRPASGGVPLPQGTAPEGTRFVLREETGGSVPLQTSVLARWKDGSARWVLLDFPSAPAAHGTTRYALSWGKDTRTDHPEAPTPSDRQPPASAHAENVTVEPGLQSVARIGGRLDVRLTLTDGEGRKYNGVVGRVEAETQGSFRSTWVITGGFHSPEDETALSFRMRATAFAGLSTVVLEPQLLISPRKGVIQNIRELKLEIAPLQPIQSVIIGGAPGWKGRPASRLRLFQSDDQHYRFEGGEGRGSKAPGWAEIADGGRSNIAVAVKDFWQQWPKSIEADSKTLSIGLFPAFEAGEYDAMTPWYKYQYLFEGDHYRLRTGQAPRWQIWLDMAGDGAALAAMANAPLVPAADPQQAIATGAWGPIAAAGTRGMKDYDAWAENLFDNGYGRSIEAQRDYGQMNWGDWFGERRCNWGNHEYDTPKHILVQFARTGDPKYFHVGNMAARHTSEIDVIHFVNDDLRNYFEVDLRGRSQNYPTRPGMVHEHCVGHVGGFYSVAQVRDLYISLGIGNSRNPYLCLDPYNLGHVFTQGMVYDYFLTGDPWMKETVEKIGNNLAQLVEDRKFAFKGHSHCGRVNGWTMLAIAGVYDLDFANERCLKAMKLLADDALSEQDAKTGGWLYKLPAGHCDCEVKHIGEAGFIGSIRLNGLSRYHELTGDKRIPPAVKRGVDHLNEDTWLEDRSDWRYTSCPKTSPIGQTGVTIAALVNSVVMNRDAGQLRILRKAWDTKFKRLLVAPKAGPGLGKAYSTIMYGCPEAMNLFANGLEEGKNSSAR